MIVISLDCCGYLIVIGRKSAIHIAVHIADFVRPFQSLCPLSLVWIIRIGLVNRDFDNFMVYFVRVYPP